MSPGPHDPTARDVAALFAGSRLTVARRLAGLRKVDLAARVDRTPTAVAAYEVGRSRPSPATVARLCVALSVEPSFFLATPSTAIDLDGRIVPHFRSLRSTTQLARDQAGAFGGVVHDVVACFERHVELPERDVPAHGVGADDGSFAGPAGAAGTLRRAWHLTGPVAHLLRTAEHHGVVTTFSPVQAASVDAYSFETPTRPIVVLNPLKSDYYRQRFDLGHELGHLVMHGDADPGGRTVESQANRFAAELLMPADEIADQLPRRLNWPQLMALKEHWGVSLQALLYRARELRVLSDTTYRNAMARMSREGWRRREPGARTEVEQPSLLPRALALLEDAGIEAARLAAQARAPIGLFRTITAPTPEHPVPEHSTAERPALESSATDDRPGQPDLRVRSLLR